MIRYNLNHNRLDLYSVFLGIQRHYSEAIIYSHRWWEAAVHMQSQLQKESVADGFIVWLCASHPQSVTTLLNWQLPHNMVLHVNKLQFLLCPCTKQKFWLVISWSFQGTTGSPKAATLSHFNQVNNAYLVGNRVGFSWKVKHRVWPETLIFN